MKYEYLFENPQTFKKEWIAGFSYKDAMERFLKDRGWYVCEMGVEGTVDDMKKEGGRDGEV